jgi:glycosyltransferase involved in cell wall biosynthesis
MKILAVHNYYQLGGGEDTAYEHEIALLRRHGHEVITHERSNKETGALSSVHKAGLAINTIWSQSSNQEIAEILSREKPDLVHFHNTHLMISPSAYYACKDAGVPVVQSLDNPRLICPAATLYRDGHVCHDCVGKTPPWPGVVHACYRGSRAQTAVVAAMLTAHRILGSWQNLVDRYLVATDFYRALFIEGGLPEEKLLLKRHFVDPDPGLRSDTAGGYALFVGRLDPEKGIRLMLEAWRPLSDIPLKIRGDGPLLNEVQAASAANANITLIPRLPADELTALIKGARFLLWPSQGHYETFGFVAAEAFACGVPVIASNAGVMSELVQHQKNGLLFEQESPADLVSKVRWAWDHGKEMAALGRQSRIDYETRYSADATYPQLMAAYESALASR